jgi:hypothetical protein
MQNNLDNIERWWQRCGCTSNPGPHTGEELARDGEIRELRMYAKKLESLIEDLQNPCHGYPDEGYDDETHAG